MEGVLGNGYDRGKKLKKNPTALRLSNEGKDVFFVPKPLAQGLLQASSYVSHAGQLDSEGTLPSYAINPLLLFSFRAGRGQSQEPHLDIVSVSAKSGTPCVAVNAKCRTEPHGLCKRIHKSL